MTNTHDLSRRRFLATTSAMALGAALSAPSLGGAAQPSGKWVISTRDNLLKDTGIGDCWEAMRFLQVDGVEVDITPELTCPNLKSDGRGYGVATGDDVKRLKDDFAKNGMKLTAFCMHNQLDTRLEEEIAWTAKVVKAAEALGVKTVRIDVAPRKLGVEQFLPFAVNACKKLVDTTADTEVRLGVENHGKVTNDPVFLDKLFDGVGSSKLGLTLDCMNFYWWGHPLNDLYSIIQRVAPRAFHTHCKNLKYPADKKNDRRPIGWEYAKYSAPVFDGDIDYRKVAAILRKSGYQGDFCLENESLKHFPKEEHPAVLKKEIATLRLAA